MAEVIQVLPSQLGAMAWGTTGPENSEIFSSYSFVVSSFAPSSFEVIYWHGRLNYTAGMVRTSLPYTDNIRCSGAKLKSTKLTLCETHSCNTYYELQLCSGSVINERTEFTSFVTYAFILAARYSFYVSLECNSSATQVSRAVIATLYPSNEPETNYYVLNGFTVMCTQCQPS